MDTKTKWILFMAVVLAISILWPLAYMMRHSPQPNQPGQNNSGQGPITITPLDEYTGEINVTIEKVKPVLYAVGYGNAGSREELKKLISSWDGVLSVNVSRTESNKPNYLYRFDIIVNLTNWTLDEKIGFWMNRLLPIHVDNILVPVEASIPSNVTLRNSKTGELRKFKLPRDTLQFAYYYTKPGNASAMVFVEVSGERIKKAMLVAGSPFYIPPMNNVFTSITGQIKKLEKGVILASASPELNDTQLSKEWNASVKLFTPENSTNASLRVEFNPERMDEMTKKVSEVANITDSYYLAQVEIPKKILVDGEEKEVPSTIVDDVKVYRTEGNVTFTARISEAFGLIVGVSYGGKF